MKKVISWAVMSGALFSIVMFAPPALADEKTHDGFYLQLAGGFGYLSSTAESGGYSVTYSGVALPSQLLLGGTLGGGFVLGGGFFGDYVPAPNAEQSGGGVTVSGSLNDVTLTLIGIGPFMDFYPDPKGGLHFQGLVGFGAMEATFQGNSGGSDPTGVVLSLGVGHDWWVGREWSIGVMGRFVYAPLSLNGIDYSTIAPAVLATFTYN